MKTYSKFLLVFLTASLLGFTSAANAQETPAALNFTMKSIEGKDVKLSKYAGKVIVLVNVASKCGLTPQYEQLQALHKEYADKGVAIVGVPCNQFGGQEPGTEAEILEFCQENYSVEFDLLAKVDVNGEKQCDLYKHLNAMDLAPRGKGTVKWNFEKYVIDKTGKPIGRFSSRTKPDSDEFIAVIKKALAAGTANTTTAPYTHTSSKSGTKYYLYSGEVKLKNSDKVRTNYFFAKDSEHATGKPVTEIPEGKVVSELKNGLPVLKNKDSAKKK